MANHVASDTKEFFREYHLWVLLIVACALAAWVVAQRTGESLPGSKIDPFSGPLVIDASGCEINGPDGKSIKEAIREQNQTQGKAFIPKGATLNGDCFPAAKAARAAESNEKSPVTQPAGKSGRAHNCVTTGPNSPIVIGEKSVVVIDGKTYTPGQSTDCAPESNNISTHGANSPIVTGAGAQVTIKTER